MTKQNLSANTANYFVERRRLRTELENSYEFLKNYEESIVRSLGTMRHLSSTAYIFALGAYVPSFWAIQQEYYSISGLNTTLFFVLSAYGLHRLSRRFKRESEGIGEAIDNRRAEISRLEKELGLLSNQDL